MLLRRCVIAAAGLLVLVAPAHAQHAELGTISFPNSGSQEAQPYFLEGVKALHSFEWDDAADAFKKAQEIDPAFALAYWGEALSYTGGHHFSPEQDISKGREALTRLAATRAERLAKATDERERGFLEAVEDLYGAGDAKERALKYAEAMRRLHVKYPDDHEAATFYALALMRTERRGVESRRVDMKAGAIAQAVFRQNPDHPGAAHYIIHAFDEPAHAPIAEYAAHKYSTIAPDAPHALHMPSHIFVQLGKWDHVADLNRLSFDASERRSTRKQLDNIEGHAFHSIYWLHYAYLMQGKYAEAERAVAEAEPYASQEDAGPYRSGQYNAMKARQIIETERWQKTDVSHILDDIRTSPDDVSARVVGAALLAQGLSAARLGDVAAAEQAEAGLRDLEAAVKKAGRIEPQQVGIMHREVAALVRLAKQQGDEAVRLLGEAVAIEEKMEPPSGPPGEAETDPPLKPSHELFGEVLLELDRPADAARQFAIGLDRMPNRPRLLLGAARAAAKAGDATAARVHYQSLLDTPDAGPDLPGADEARAYLAGRSEP